MKIRKGFVSNSSSSSFILIGKELSNEEALEMMETSPEKVVISTDEWGGEGEYIYDGVPENMIQLIKKYGIPRNFEFYEKFKSVGDGELHLTQADLIEVSEHEKVSIVSFEADYHEPYDEKKEFWNED